MKICLIFNYALDLIYSQHCNRMSTWNQQGLTNCTYGDERAYNVHAKRFLRARNYTHINRSKHL